MLLSKKNGKLIDNISFLTCVRHNSLQCRPLLVSFTDLKTQERWRQFTLIWPSLSDQYGWRKEDEEWKSHQPMENSSLHSPSLCCGPACPPGDLRLVCSCSFKKTTNRPFLHATRSSTQRSRSVSLCGLPLHGWTVVTARCFHFTTTLTVDQGSSSRAEIWRTDLLEMWHSMTVTELFSKAILLPMFVCGDCMAVYICYYTPFVFTLLLLTVYYLCLVTLPLPTCTNYLD
jgi:hypothetical protein